MNARTLRNKPLATRRLPALATLLCAALAAHAWFGAAPGFAQAASCVRPPAGMVAWWPGDGDARDIRGASHGTPQNGATFAAGKVGQAFSFDGADDGVSLGDVAAFDFNQSSSFTIDAWVRHDGSNGQTEQFIVALNYNCTPTRQSLQVIEGGPDAGKVLFLVRDADDAASSVTSPAALPVGEFRHVAATREVTTGGKTLNLYIDGALVASAPDVTTGALASNATDWIGRRNVCPDAAAFNGVIDEVEVFNRALSQAEVSAIYGAGGAGKCRFSCVAAPAGMQAWYTGDGHARDIQGPDYENGAPQGGAAYAAGRVAQAFSFSNSGVDAVVAPASSSDDAFAALTLDAWVFPVSHGSVDGIGRAVISKTETDGFALRVRDGFLEADLRLSGGDLIQTFGGQTSPLPLNQWSHVAITYDGAAVRGYVNGVSVGSAAASGAVRNGANSATCLMIGNEPSGCALQNSGFAWEGRIDEVEVFARALSQAEIQSIYNAGEAGKCKGGQSAGSVIISEFRLGGPGGGCDEFVELYNTSDSPVTVADASSTPSGTAGWALVSSDEPSAPKAVVPAGTVIPARGHLLVTNTGTFGACTLSGYSLGGHPAGGGANATGDVSYSGVDIPPNSGLALFRTSDPDGFSAANRLDAAGFNNSPSLFREGAGLPPMTSAFASQHAFVRDNCGKQGSTTTFGLCTTGGRPRDTDSNAADFYFVNAEGTDAGAGRRLGAPGPENLSSPVERNPSFGGPLLDATRSASAAPNRVRDTAPDPANNSQFGTLSIRKRVVNNTGGAVTRLRFRIVDVTTLPAPSGVADLRARTSADVSVSAVGDAATCAAAGLTAPCAVTARGTSLETPPSQPLGGGFNATLSAGTVTLAAPLADGASINVQFLLGVQQTGSFKFYVNVEALP